MSTQERHPNRLVILLLLTIACALTFCQAPPKTKQNATGDDREIGCAAYVGEYEVRNYWPSDSMVNEDTYVAKAKFPAVDVHCHWRIDVDPHEMLQAMDDRNVKRAVNLSGGHGDDLDAMVKKYLGVDSERFVIFLNLPFNKIDEPGFADWAVKEIRRAHNMGVRGLKIFKSLGLYHRDSKKQLVKIDDERLNPIWTECGKLNMPVLIHTADPVAFFKPIDANNERWMQLQRHPSWGFYGKDNPPREELLAARNRVIERHPNTTFIGAHVANNAENLQQVAADLDRYPNLVCDISGRVNELGRQPYSSRDFLIKYQDRVMFATDRYPGRKSQPRYRIYFRFLETRDEYFDYFKHKFPPAGEWKIYGVYLPDDVLKKVYHDNAERVLGFAKR